VEDLGARTSYLTLAKGVPVYARDGKAIGHVERVVADPDADLFEGVVINNSRLPGGARFAGTAQVEEIYEQGVVLRIDQAEADALPPPP